MNEQKRMLRMILYQLGITYQYKCIGTRDVYFCRYGEVTFSILINGQNMNMNKYLGHYSSDQQNTVFCLGQNAKQKGYDIVLIDDNGEKHIGLNVLCSWHTDKQQLFFSICYFLQIISIEKFLQIKSL